MITKHLRLFLTITLFVLFSLSSFAQQLDHELKVLDLEVSPAFEKPINNKFEADGKLFLTAGNGLPHDLLSFNGIELSYILSNYPQEISILGELNDGLILMIGHFSTTQYLYHLDHATHTLTSLHEFGFNYKSITFLDDVAVFLNWDGGLFATDGTPAGTQLVKQFDSFVSSIEIDYHFNNQILFFAEQQFWRTDGTIAGTYILVDNTTFLDEESLIVSNDLTYFYNSSELWRTDGTLPGTEAIIDGLDYNFQRFIKTEEGITFLRTTAEFGKEFWTTDGTSNGTQILTDLIPGPESGFDNPSAVWIKNDSLFIFKGSGIYENEIWVSDGTLDGTVSVKDLTGLNGYGDFNLINECYKSANGQVFFMTTNSINERTLWALDIAMTEATQIMIIPEFISGAYSSGEKLFFEFYSGGDQLWVTDGTLAGTIHLSTFSGNINYLGTYDDKLFFTHLSGNSGTVGNEPMVSDGTIAGTQLLKDINSGTSGSNLDPDLFFTYNNQYFFYAEDNILGQSFYTTDGTESGTLPVFDLYPNSQSSDLDDLTHVAGKLYFVKDDNLWASNGTLDGTINLEIPTSNFTPYGVIDDKVLFFKSTNELWVSNGTIAGTQLLLNTVSPFFWPSHSTKMDNQLWFFYDDGVNGIELYKSDGTIAGTEIAFESMPGSESIFDDMFNTTIATNGNLLFFPNTTATEGTEPWISDGTLAGTMILKDVTPGPNSSDPTSFSQLDDKVLFHSFNPAVTQVVLWSSDGTESGTITLKETSINVNIPVIQFEDNLVFVNNSYELWKSNGTVDGTQLIYDLDLSFPKMELYNDKIIFELNHPDFGEEPWITDGTPDGTMMIKDVNEGTNDSSPSNFTSVQDVSIFTAKGASNTHETLWQTDGISDGTMLATNYTFGELNDISHLNMYRGKLFFIAHDQVYGEEIHFMDFNISENIEGLVYNDLNANGEKDPDENGINNVPVSAYSNGDEIVSYTDSEGKYKFFALEDEYDIQPILNQCWNISSDSLSYTVDAGIDLLSGLDFGFNQISEEGSLWHTINSATTRCGFTVPFWINIANDGCEIISGDIVIELDDLVELVSTTQTPTTIDGNTIIWGFSDIDLGATHQIRMNLLMPDEQSDGEEIFIPSQIFLLDDNNALTLESENTFSSTISCAIDPNDKNVVPDRSDLSEDNYTLFDEELNYTIRFQNTGSDTAFTVKITDTLSPLLDFSTFEPMIASHPFRTTTYPGGIVEFLFEDILLPDSTTNEQESHGFVTFRIKSLEGIEELSEINNTAYIYFDFNSPVITNTINSTLVSTFDADNDGFFIWEDCDDNDPEVNPAALEIANNSIDENCDGIILSGTNTLEMGIIDIFPNPTSNRIEIRLPEKMKVSLKVTDTKGLIINKQTFDNNTFVDLTNYVSGLYLMELIHIDSGAKVVRKIVKI